MADKLKLEAFCVVHQQEDMTKGRGEPSWTLSYKLAGENGYHIHVISGAYAKRLMDILQGEPDQLGFVIPFLSQKLYEPDQVAKGFVRAMKATDLAIGESHHYIPTQFVQAATEAVERLTATILAGIGE